MLPRITFAAICLTVLSAAPSAAATRNHHFNTSQVVSGVPAGGSKGLEGLAASDSIKAGLCSSPLTHGLRAVLCGLQPTSRTSPFHTPAIADLGGVCEVGRLAARREDLPQVAIGCSPPIDFIGDAIAPAADGLNSAFGASERVRFMIGSSRAGVA